MIKAQELESILLVYINWSLRGARGHTKLKLRLICRVTVNSLWTQYPLLDWILFQIFYMKVKWTKITHRKWQRRFDFSFCFAISSNHNFGKRKSIVLRNSGNQKQSILPFQMMMILLWCSTTTTTTNVIKHHELVSIAFCFSFLLPI